MHNSATPLTTILREDLDTAIARDPAARSRLEVALTYPGVHALWGHRLAHALWFSPFAYMGARLLARMVSHVTRTITLVDIHPAAELGRRLFIDHATGVVIGETAVVGEDCVIFHGVTLGGVSMSKGKRHPTVGNRVLIGAGAKVLGPIRIGDDAKVGANAVVVKEVPEGAAVVGVPARIVKLKSDAQKVAFVDDPTLYI
ncbi:serine O-acetyltransferase [Boudabousia marimammalium]|uniref:Serine acetyltransferase n=1 Tax=Boudabousia marimammalium TaxID=156892 RepID=A0A1Q5PP40_9ACTO|nr:serine O-acetyltransferase [Boudabousia marimammalium]OKL49344.1 serine O-acetyltransferase [Boudabousia marimammalium]